MKAEILSLHTILLKRNTVFEPRLKSLKKGEVIPKKLHCCEQPVNDSAVYNERASMCKNCQALKRDYGQELYERDLQIVNFRPGDVLKHDEADGMDIFLFSLVQVYFNIDSNCTELTMVMVIALNFKLGHSPFSDPLLSAFLAHLAFLPMFVKQKMSTLGPADSY